MRFARSCVFSTILAQLCALSWWRTIATGLRSCALSCWRCLQKKPSSFPIGDRERDMDNSSDHSGTAITKMLHTHCYCHDCLWGLLSSCSNAIYLLWHPLNRHRSQRAAQHQPALNNTKRAHLYAVANKLGVTAAAVAAAVCVFIESLFELAEYHWIGTCLETTEGTDSGDETTTTITSTTTRRQLSINATSCWRKLVTKYPAARVPSQSYTYLMLCTYI